MIEYKIDKERSSQSFSIPGCIQLWGKRQKSPLTYLNLVPCYQHVHLWNFESSKVLKRLKSEIFITIDLGRLLGNLHLHPMWAVLLLNPLPVYSKASELSYLSVSLSCAAWMRVFPSCFWLTVSHHQSPPYLLQ